jgi:hypothetical protein
MYRLQSLVRDAPPSQVVEGQTCAIEGELGDYVLVSVPPSISHQAAKALQESFQKTLGKQVMIFTHNVAFLCAEKMTAQEVNEVLKEVEDGIASQDSSAVAPAEAQGEGEAAPVAEAAPAAPEADAPGAKDP